MAPSAVPSDPSLDPTLAGIPMSQMDLKILSISFIQHYVDFGNFNTHQLDVHKQP